MLDVVQGVARIVPLAEILSLHEAGKSTTGLAALTFDDACLSIQTVAAPMLRARGVPASVFAVRDAALSGVPYWWDRLSLLTDRLLPEEWATLAAALGMPDGGADHDRARDTIVARHRGTLPDPAAAVFATAEARLGVATGYDRSMTTAELAALAADPLFDIGIHTVTHRALPLLTDEEMRAEIADCHAWLAESLPSVLPVLAIPFGLRDDRTLRLARDTGMRAVLRIAPRMVRGTNCATGYPRFMVSERRSGWKLGAGLLGVQELLRNLGLRDGPDDPVMPVA